MLSQKKPCKKKECIFLVFAFTDNFIILSVVCINQPGGGGGVPRGGWIVCIIN